MSDKKEDYRVNLNPQGKIISIEITCCGQHIGEVRLKEGEARECPLCGGTHMIKVEHNHFHIRRVRGED